MGLGSVLSYLPFYDRIFEKTALRVLILGLNGGVGKTTVLYKIKDGTTVSTMHTVGYNVEKFDVNNLTLEFFDIGGGDKIIPLWRHYFPGTKAVIFVINSTERDRLDIVLQELTILWNHEDLEKVPFLLLANKQDQPDAMSLEELKTALNLDAQRKNRSILLQAAVATEGTGLKEGMEWLCAEIQKII